MKATTNEDQINSLRSHFDTDKIGDIEVLIWDYTYEEYQGSAFVLYRDNTDGLLYEVHGGHCSCYGLEGQWSPERSDTARLQLWVDTMKNERDDLYYRREQNDRRIADLEATLATLEDQVGDIYLG